MSFNTQWELEITDTKDTVHLVEMDAFPIQCTSEKEFEDFFRETTAGLILKKVERKVVLVERASL